MSTDSIEIIGAPGSPYTRKMRSLQHYRRIGHRFRIRGSRDCPPKPDVPVALIPIPRSSPHAKSAASASWGPTSRPGR
jgi:hypothetical protein